MEVIFPNKIERKELSRDIGLWSNARFAVRGGIRFDNASLS